MPLFETFKVGDNYDTLMNTASSTWLFDYNVEVLSQGFAKSFDEKCGDGCKFGKNRNSGTSSTQKKAFQKDKKLYFVLKKYVAVDSVFVSSSNSLGVLFLKNTKIFITRPVYEQIILRYEEIMEINRSLAPEVELDSSRCSGIRDDSAFVNDKHEFETLDFQTCTNQPRSYDYLVEKRGKVDTGEKLKTKKQKLSNKEENLTINNKDDITKTDFQKSTDSHYLLCTETDEDSIESQIANIFNIDRHTILFEDNDCFVVSFDNVSLENFKKNVIFIRNFHTIEKEGYLVESVPAGTFIGCCNYKVTFPNKKSILILNSYSSKRRFSIEAPKIDSNFLLLAKNSSSLRFESVHLLSVLFKEYCKSSSINLYSLGIESFRLSQVKSLDCSLPILITVNFQTFFIEILFHILSIVEPYGLEISIISPIYTQLETLLNIQSEWLNKDFFSISEPFPLKQYGKIKVVEKLSEIEGNKRIVFCSNEYYSINKSKIFGCTVLKLDTGRGYRDTLINEDEHLTTDSVEISDLARYKKTLQVETVPVIYFNLKIENTDEEIVQDFKGDLIKKSQTFLDGENDVDFISVNSNLTVYDGRVVLNGDLFISDFDNPKGIEKIFKDKKADVKNLLSKEQPIYIDGWYYLVESNVKFKIHEETIEIENINTK